MANDGNFTHDIIGKKIYKEYDKKKIVPKEYRDKGYPHLTFKVSDICEYLEIVKILSRARREDFVNDKIIYRGMADKTWKPLPQLARVENLDDGREFNMVNNLLALRPEEFVGLNSSFEILAKMQHYRLPTRLLDFTTNPLIALFFACNDLIGTKDARIICHRAYIQISRDDLLEEICGFYKYRAVEDIYLDDLRIKPKKYLQKIYRSNDDRLLVARPYYWNDRIKRQEAIFMAFVNKLHDCYGVWAYGGRENYDIHWKRHQSSLEMVGREPLDKMYAYATQRNFTLSHESVKEMYNYYEENGSLKKSLNEWGEPFAHRFQFDADIQPIDEETMKTEFCSIIIDKKQKQKILKELETVGVDEAYVYPELEYTTKKIKNIFIN